MRYENPQLIEALAREYVLGTLHGPARTRFESVLAASLTARRAVLQWESRLAPLAAAVPRVEPPPHVWAGIEAAVSGRARPARSAGIWPALAAGLAALALLFGGLYVGSDRSDQARYVAVFTEATTPVWVVQAFTEQLRVSTINDRPLPATNSYELWMVPEGGAAPVSLGLIPQTGNAALPLSAQANTVLAQSSNLAVSVEPAGGSPTGAPTTVILVAPLLRV